MIFKYLKNGLLFYWYTGNKRIAITGFLIASIINLFLLYITIGGFGIIYFIIMLIMDHLIILCLAFYLIIRNYIPDLVLNNLNLDSFIFENLLILLGCWLINRIIINLTAEKIYKYELK
ncbi:putative membrane protein [Aliarcobacter cibarius]|uniref:hypothetical protein n=1 Tax=Aliarcobacter cibarius TaxID=255507 RepID=UPI0012489B6C|nr:hypothetical protein [Aliarcobacter cibarius]QEZ88363.1 putative membrane protein [Aliarcobacter cibarius]